MVTRKQIYIPERGDIIWLTFGAELGHEQHGRRPALVVSPSGYNTKTEMALCCPITSQIKSYPFEVLINKPNKISGAILSDHIRNIDLKARKAEFADRISDETLEEVTNKIILLIKQ